MMTFFGLWPPSVDTMAIKSGIASRRETLRVLFQSRSSQDWRECYDDRGIDPHIRGRVNDGFFLLLHCLCVLLLTSREPPLFRTSFHVNQTTKRGLSQHAGRQLWINDAIILFSPLDLCTADPISVYLPLPMSFI